MNTWLNSLSAAPMAWLIGAAAVWADPPQLGFPLLCELGMNCYIEDYVDLDPGQGLRDHACGVKTREGHRGTDIGLLTFEAMESGVYVVAAAPGKVTATRDGEPDRAVTPETRASVEGRECGNAVRIDHGDGWQTLYCHLAKDSVEVRRGLRVAAGTPLGRVGLSGLTNQPHLHFAVTKDDEVVDPFLGRTAAEGASCGDMQASLWAEPPAYDRAGLFTAGFATDPPDLEDVQTGAARVREAGPEEALYLYANAFYAEAGDVLEFRVLGPDGGEILSRREVLEAPGPQEMRAAAQEAPPGGWEPGDYRGYVTLARAGRVMASRHADVKLRND
ncbi:MAG: M23 family metallopeptidase [Roseovarius sp.]